MSHIKLKVVSVLAGAATLAAAVPTWYQPRADTSTCPYYLPEGNYEFPHLIVPINKSDTAIGHSYFAEVSPNNCATIFNFDIPPSRANQQCSVYFTFPRHDQLDTSDFTWNGSNSNTRGQGSLQLVQYAYNTGATDATTGNTEPPRNGDPPIVLNGVSPGNSYKAWSGNCGVGGVMSWGMSSTDSSLMYFQDWNLCALGLWVVYENVLPVQAPSCGSCPDHWQFSSHAAWMRAYTGEAGFEVSAMMSSAASTSY